MTTNMSTSNLHPTNVSAASASQVGGAPALQDSVFGLGGLPDPAVLARLANALFAALPGQPVATGMPQPPATPEVGTETGARPSAPAGAALAALSESELRNLPAALAGLIGASPQP